MNTSGPGPTRCSVLDPRYVALEKEIHELWLLSQVRPLTPEEDRELNRLRHVMIFELGCHEQGDPGA